MPLSATRTKTFLPLVPTVMSILPPSGVYLTALETMLVMTCSMRSRSPLTSGMSPSQVSVIVWWWFCSALSFAASYTFCTAFKNGKREIFISILP